MFLANGGDSLHFKYRKFTGVSEDVKVVPDWLVLDGQQRLTTLFQVFKSRNAVQTCLETNKDKSILRYYYLDIKKCLDPDADRLGIYAKDIKTGEYKDFTGNMSGLLIAEYRLSALKEKLGNHKLSIGQGNKKKTGLIGIGNCTKGFRYSVKGCPPERDEIVAFLKDFIAGV